MVTWDSVDLDNSASETGVVHESVTNADHNDASLLKQGYEIANPYLSTIGYWPLHENSGGTAYEFSGNAPNGITNGGVTQGVSGLLGTTAYSFDGTDDYVDISSPNDVFSGNQEYSFSAWVKADSSRNGTETCVSVGALNDVHFNTKGINSNPPELQIWNGSTNNFVKGDTDITGGGWNFIVATYDPNDGMTFYQNATQTDTNSFTGSSNNSPDDTCAIGDRPRKDRQHTGDIADVRIHDVELTSSQVQFMYDVVKSQGSLTTQFKTI